MSGPFRLRIENLDKTFTRPGKPSIGALRGIAMSIREGEFVSIVGASGSGKSTLLRIIDGLLPASAGAVYVDDQPVTGPGWDRAMVFQQDSLLPWKTVIENVAYGLRLALRNRTVLVAPARMVGASGAEGRRGTVLRCLGRLGLPRRRQVLCRNPARNHRFSRQIQGT